MAVIIPLIVINYSPQIAIKTKIITAKKIELKIVYSTKIGFFSIIDLIEYKKKKINNNAAIIPKISIASPPVNPFISLKT